MRVGEDRQPRLKQRRAPSVHGLLVGAESLAVLALAVHPSWRHALSVAQTLGPYGRAATRGLAMACAIGLLLITRGLTRRNRRAWAVALLLLIAMLVMDISHGVNLALATVDGLLLAGLLHWRREFDRHGDPLAPRRALLYAAGAFALLGAAGLAILLTRSEFRAPDIGVLDALRKTLAAFVGVNVAPALGRFGRTFTLTMSIAAASIAVVTLWYGLRPPRSVPPSSDDRRLVADLVASSVPDTLAYFVLRSDKHYFIEGGRRAALAYRAAAGIALVSGDPVGDQRAFDELLDQFARLCRARAWRIAVIGVSEALCPAWQRLGLRTIYVGDEAVVVPQRFSLEGRAMRKVRQSVHRLQRAGYQTRVAYARELGEAEWRAIGEVSAAYRPEMPRQGFSMAADDLRAREFADAVLVLATDADGRLAGFAHLVPVPSSTALSLGAVRRVPQTPNGFTEYLFCETFVWAKEQGVETVSLTFNAFGRLLRGEYEPRSRHRLARWGIRRLEHVAQVERLYQFNRKFLPDWLPRHFACESLTDLPAALLLLAGLERLIYVPYRLRRGHLWRRTLPAADEAVSSEP